MRNIIEELYYGNIDPQARNTKRNKVVSKQMKVLSDAEAYLIEALTDKNKQLFIDYTNAWSIVNAESNLDSFIIGFRLGAKFTFDTFASNESPFEDLLKE